MLYLFLQFLIFRYIAPLLPIFHWLPNNVLQINESFLSTLHDFTPLIVSNILVIGFFIFFQNNTDKVKSQYQSHIAELEARSLKAQMDPHFIFNAINGIQSLLLLKGERETNRYIAMLSKILRFSLEQNTNEVITLEEEVDYLTAYIELQKMRLNKKLDYCFDFKLKNKKDNYLIPPMLIQPLVENAILHGIIPLEGKGILLITITEKDNMLRVMVEDNGIGLKASRKLKEVYKKKHKSHATQILRERIDIYNYLKNQKMIFFIEDLNNPKISAGTRAVIIIPIIKNKTVVKTPVYNPLH